MNNKLNSIFEIAEYLRKNRQSLKPLSTVQIKKIEEKFQVVLPEVYKQFLILMGNGAGNYMRGSSVFFDEIFLLKEWADDLVQENGLSSLPDNAFVFWMHQGYQAAYFITDASNDPPVYFFSEGQNLQSFVLKEHSLTDFFVNQLLTSENELENS